LSGMIDESDTLSAESNSRFQPGDFLYLDTTRRLLIVLGGPVTSLAVGLLIAAYSYEVAWQEVLYLVLQLLFIVMLSLFLVKKLGPLVNTSLEKKTLSLPAILFFLFVSMMVYGGFFYLLIYSVDGITDFLYYLENLLMGKYKFKYLINRSYDHRLPEISRFVGVAFFIFNLLPLGGLNGGVVLTTLFESFTGVRLREKYLSNFAMVSFLFTIGLYLFVFYQLL